MSPFRRTPWLYIFIGLVSLGIVAVLLFAVWYNSSQQGPGSSTSTAPIETPQERSNRLAIMNILNAFHLEEAAIPKTAPAHEREEATRQHVNEVISKLDAINLEGSLRSTQGDLVAVFKHWSEGLGSADSLTDVRSDFITIASRYPWLNTLVWIIILNRL